jgi:hypothetical protein
MLLGIWIKMNTASVFYANVNNTNHRNAGGNVQGVISKSFTRQDGECPTTGLTTTQ